MEVMLVILAGILCGFLNTVASSGSAVSLPLLMLLGMTPALANGTNRIPVLIAAIAASLTFIRARLIDPRLAIKVLVPTTLGSLVGAYLVDQLQPGKIKLLISMAVLIALLLLLSGIKKMALISEISKSPTRYRWQEFALLLLVGIWLGYIVLDGAAFLLMVLVLGLRLSLAPANVYKNLALASATAVSLVIFSLDGNVDWEIGFLMALGGVGGGYIGARVAMLPLAKIWTFRLLVSIILLELIHMGISYLH